MLTQPTSLLIKSLNPIRGLIQSYLHSNGICDYLEIQRTDEEKNLKSSNKVKAEYERLFSCPILLGYVS